MTDEEIYTGMLAELKEQEKARKAAFIELAKGQDLGNLFDFLEDNKCDLSFLDGL